MHPDGHFVLGLDEFANIHPPTPAAGNLKDVAVRGAHFKYAILVSESFDGTLHFYVGCLDHCSHSREEKDQQELGRSRGKLNGCSGRVNRHHCGALWIFEEIEEIPALPLEALLFSAVSGGQAFRTIRSLSG